ncbi:hypothetical protein NUSPORA_02940 [Nucleospora cyclopteri]
MRRKYDLLAYELSVLYKCKTKIIPYVMMWEGVLTNYHKRYLKELEIPNNVKAYIQSLVSKKMLESILIDHRRNLIETAEEEEEVEYALERLEIAKARRKDASSVY